MMRVLMLSAIVLGSSCAHQGGHPVSKMAEFDLQCDRDKLRYKKITSTMYAVRGCGKQAKYVKICGAHNYNCNWVQN